MRTNLRRFVVFAISILCTICLLLYFDTRTNLRHIPNARWASERRSSPPPLANATSAPTPNTTSAVKTIFCASKLYDPPTWGPFFPAWGTYKPVRCEGGYRCRWVRSSEGADALIFHAREVGTENKRLHLTRQPHQRWVWFSWESIVHGNIHLNASWNQLFNWTATYMRNSDIWTPVYRGFMRRTAPLPTPLYTAAEKRKFAFAVISHCNPKGRLRLIKGLRRFVQVDVFGRCEGRKLDFSSKVMWQLSRRYRFYLAVENSHCEDYITEKFWRNGLMGHAVPVVYGGLSRRDYDNVAPPNSFIYAQDFPTVKALATALRRIASNESEYAGYFAWKRRWQVDPYYMGDTVMCRLCERLHVDARPALADINAFWDIKKRCRKDTPMPDT